MITQILQALAQELTGIGLSVKNNSCAPFKHLIISMLENNYPPTPMLLILITVESDRIRIWISSSRLQRWTLDLLFATSRLKLIQESPVREVPLANPDAFNIVINTIQELINSQIELSFETSATLHSSQQTSTQPIEYSI